MRLGAILSAAILATLPSLCFAQASGFTLFGPTDSEGLSLAPERKAVAPLTGPYYHEDSFITTDVRSWFVYQSFPSNDDHALGGGEARVYAAEIRFAITDRLQFVANKDGYVDLDTGLTDADGWNDIAAGLKYALIKDWKNDFHVSVGVGYQFAFGDEDVFQNTQQARGWLSVNKGFGRLHLGGVVNYMQFTGIQGVLGNSDVITAHVHADYWVCKWFSPVLEANAYFVADEGKEVVDFSGADVANFGGGDDLVTGAVGFEIRPMERVGIRVAYETDLTTDADSIFGYRWTFSATYSF
jgi:hypothetical protein